MICRLLKHQKPLLTQIIFKARNQKTKNVIFDQFSLRTTIFQWLHTNQKQPTNQAFLQKITASAAIRVASWGSSRSQHAKPTFRVALATNRASPVGTGRKKVICDIAIDLNFVIFVVLKTMNTSVKNIYLSFLNLLSFHLHLLYNQSGFNFFSQRCGVNQLPKGFQCPPFLSASPIHYDGRLRFDTTARLVVLPSPLPPAPGDTSGLRI